MTFPASAASDPQLPRPAWLAWGALAFFIPWQLHYDYILNIFYHFGAAYPDAGLFAHLLWHNDWRLMHPHNFANFSYFAVHFSPLFILISQLSYFLPTHRVEFFAGFMATVYASLSLAMFYSFSLFLTLRRHWQLAGLALLSIAFAFNDIVMSGVWLCHFEYAIPVGIFLFLLQYVRGNYRLAVFFLILTLSLREDAGFHLAAILGALALIRYIDQRSFRAIAREVWFIIAVFGYSIMAFYLTGAVSNAYHYNNSTYAMIYSGRPSFAHLSWAMFLARLHVIGEEHIYLWLGFLATLAGAIRARNPYLLAGFVSCIPWFLVNWTAYNDNAGNLFNYYAFPFVLTMCWPLLAVAWRYGFPLPQAARREALALQVILVLISMVTWSRMENHLEFRPTYGEGYHPGSYRLQEGTQNRAMINDFVAKFNAGAGDLGKVAADSSVLSLINGQYHGYDVLSPSQQPSADTLIFMSVGLPEQNIMEQAHKNNLNHYYCMAGAPVCLFTNRTTQQLGILSALLMEKSLPQEWIKKSKK